MIHISVGYTSLKDTGGRISKEIVMIAPVMPDLTDN